MSIHIYNNYYSKPIKISENITIGVSKIHSLWFFLHAISEGVYANDLFLELFGEKKLCNDGLIEKLINGFRPFNSPEISKIIFKTSAKAKSIYHLKTLLLRKTSLSYNINFGFMAELLEFFEPIYDEFIWKNTYHDFCIKVEKLINFSKDSEFTSICSAVTQFYNLGKNPSLHVVLSPIPAELCRIISPVEAGIASIPIPLKSDTEQIVNLLGIIAHELCHVLYNKLPHRGNLDLKAIFQYSRVNRLIDESLATAIGNAWTYKRIIKKEKKGEWYHNPEIDRYSKSLYPDIEKYLNDKCSLDRNFTARLVHLL